jgi:hypothetical protein
VIHKLACAAAAAFLITAAGCSTTPTTGPGSAKTKEVADCDADDKAKREVPDCGFYAGPGKTNFVWWSWVSAGMTLPPVGWDQRAEIARHGQNSKAKPAATKAAKPKTTAKTAPRPSRSRRG